MGRSQIEFICCQRLIWISSGSWSQLRRNIRQSYDTVYSWSSLSDCVDVVQLIDQPIRHAVVRSISLMTVVGEEPWVDVLIVIPFIVPVRDDMAATDLLSSPERGVGWLLCTGGLKVRCTRRFRYIVARYQDPIIEDAWETWEDVSIELMMW